MKCWLPGSDGVDIAVEAAPRGGRPALFVHGFSHDRHVWRGIAGRLAPGLRAITMDLRGHGDSDWSTEGRYAVEDYAADVPRVLDGLGVDRGVLIAHSLGGNAATLAAAAHPDRYSALVLVDTGPTLSLAGLAQVGRGVAEALRSHVDRAAYREILALTYPLADAAALDRLAATTGFERPDGRVEPRMDPAVLGAPGPEMITALEERLWAALAQVRCPTLLVRGSASSMLSRDVAAKMVDGVLADGTLVEVDGAGHSVMLDAEADLAAAIDSFLASRLAADVERRSARAVHASAI